MRFIDLIELNEGLPDARISLDMILQKVGCEHNGCVMFRYSDCEQQQLVDQFKVAKLAGLIRFKEPMDWYEPTNPQAFN